MNKLLKLVVLVAVVFVIWKYVLPNISKTPAGPLRRSEATTQASGNDCTDAASHASELWGGGIGRFTNRPDADEWSRFAADVNSSIDQAEQQCSCAARECRSVREAMDSLRKLVSEFDHSIRTGAPVPDDAVQRQEQIDNTINSAGSPNG